MLGSLALSGTNFCYFSSVHDMTFLMVIATYYTLLICFMDKQINKKMLESELCKQAYKQLKDFG